MQHRCILSSVVALACLVLTLTACEKKEQPAAQAQPAAASDQAPVAKVEPPAPAPAAPAEPPKAEPAQPAAPDPDKLPPALAKIMKAGDGLGVVSPFSKFRAKIGERLGKPTRIGEMYGKPLHEWAAHDGDLCVHYRQIQPDPKAKAWTDWSPDLRVKPKDASDSGAQRDWQDCLDAEAGVAKK